MIRVFPAFATAKWQVIIADEAQAFKNVGTAVNAAMRRLDAHQRLCLTGTPVENHLGELHALLGWGRAWRARSSGGVRPRIPHADRRHR